MNFLKFRLMDTSYLLACYQACEYTVRDIYVSYEYKVTHLSIGSGMILFQ